MSQERKTIYRARKATENAVLFEGESFDDIFGEVCSDGLAIDEFCFTYRNEESGDEKSYRAIFDWEKERITLLTAIYGIEEDYLVAEASFEEEYEKIWEVLTAKTEGESYFEIFASISYYTGVWRDSPVETILIERVDGFVGEPLFTASDVRGMFERVVKAAQYCQEGFIEGVWEELTFPEKRADDDLALVFGDTVPGGIALYVRTGRLLAALDERRIKDSESEDEDLLEQFFAPVVDGEYEDRIAETNALRERKVDELLAKEGKRV